MKNNFYLDIHVLQTVPPSCINRDDTGSPKTATYGGVTRARVSSQAWKRAIRQMFADLLDPGQVGQRTKRVVEKVAEKIKELDPLVDSEALAIAALKNAGLTIKSADKGTDALFFMSDAQAKALAELIVSEEGGAEAYKAALRDNPSVDMCLFGRMVASDASLNYDACAQVAHAISTHAVSTEYDYFTAVDDRSPEDNAGAGHLGTVEFNSSTLYRYATVNVAEMVSHLGEMSAQAIQAFLKAFVCAMPTGKQNTFANRTLPDMIYITIRNDQPINMAGAFERPVLAKSEGYATASAMRLYEYANKIYRTFSCPPALTFHSGISTEENVEEGVLPFDQVINAVGEAVSKFIDCGVE